MEYWKGRIATALLECEEVTVDEYYKEWDRIDVENIGRWEWSYRLQYENASAYPQPFFYLLTCLTHPLLSPCVCQSDPELIEGDEGEVVLHSKVPRGEDLLIKDFLLDNTPTKATDTSQAEAEPPPAEAPPTLPRASTATLTQHPPAERSAPSEPHPAVAPPPIIRPVTPLSYRPRSSAQITTSNSGTELHLIICIQVLFIFIYSR